MFFKRRRLLRQNIYFSGMVSYILNAYMDIQKVQNSNEV